MEGDNMSYSTDLTDDQWLLLEPIFRTEKGKKLVKHSKRDLLNAVFYLVKKARSSGFCPTIFRRIQQFGRFIEEP
jgi:transposase